MARDVTTVADISYPDLYKRWERSNWSAYDIDFSVDRRQWHTEMDEHQRRAALWSYSLFFHGEHVVASTLGPFIDAAPLPEQKYFLATQQADEARHSVMFARFMDEVVGNGDSVHGALDATNRQLTWGFRRIFGRLDRLAAELRRDPSLPRLAAGVMLYHLIIEASLAQPGQRFIEGYLERSKLLPGLLEGMQQISRDEQRHIGFGVKLLSDVRDEPGCRDAVAAILRETLPWAACVFVPPNWDESYVEVFGYTLEDIYAFGMEGFEAKIRAAGLPPAELFGALPWRLDLSPAERARRLLKMLRANLVGEKLGPARRDPEAVQYLFETLSLSVDHRHAPSRPVTIAWDFDDFDAWHVKVDNGHSSAAPGRPPDADLVMHCGFDDFIDVAAGRQNPLLALVTRRLRPRGDLRVLLRFPKMFGG